MRNECLLYRTVAKHTQHYFPYASRTCEPCGEWAVASPREPLRGSDLHQGRINMATVLVRLRGAVIRDQY